MDDKTGAAAIEFDPLSPLEIPLADEAETKFCLEDKCRSRTLLSFYPLRL